MARLSDHDIRDAEDALRVEIGLVVKRYVRRCTELGKAFIQEEIEQKIKDGEYVNGTTIGRSAAERAVYGYFGGLAGSEPQAIIESDADLADGFA
jgi:hypothetical protein